MADTNPKPKIVYPSSVLSPLSQTTLQFVRSPRNQCAFNYEAIRHDNTASSGVREVVLERIDTFQDGDFEYVAKGNEIAAWNAFELSALQGIPFDYYPEPVTSPTLFTTYYMEDQKIQAERHSPGQYQFKHRFYQYVPWP